MESTSSNYSFEEIMLKNVEFNALSHEQLQSFNEDSIRVTFAREIEEKELPDNHRSFLVSLIVKVFNADDEHPFLSVNMQGSFIADAGIPRELADRVTSLQAPAILYPYVRQFISTITMSSNMSPLTLPLVNLGAALQQFNNNSNE